MPKRSYVRDSKGNVTAIRETSQGGSRSDLHEFDDSVVGQLIHGGKGKHIEVADHHKDGTTDAYKPDDSVIGQLLHSGKGEKKNK